MKPVKTILFLVFVVSSTWSLLGFAEQKKVSINSINWQGNSAISDVGLNSVALPLLKEPVTFEELQQVTKAVTSYYRSQGYYLTQAQLPPQTLINGALNVKVIEGFIEAANLQQPLINQTPIEGYIAPLVGVHAANIKDLELVLLGLNSLPGIQASASVAAGNAGVGSSMLVFDVAPLSPYGNITIDNRGTDLVGPTQINALWVVPHWNDWSDELSVGASTTAQNEELAAYNLGYKRAINNTVQWGLSLSKSTAKPGSVVKALALVNENLGLSASLDINLLRQRHLNKSVKLSLHVNKATANAAGAQISQDKLRSLKLLYVQDHQLSSGSMNWQVGIHQGLIIAGGSKQGSNILSRPSANLKFNKLIGQLNHVRIIPVAQADTGQWLMSTSIKGQYSGHNLPASEEFSVGGAEFGKAYDGGAIAGDSGVAVGVEFSHIDSQAKGWKATLASKLFLEAGWAKQNDPAVGVASRAKLASAGFGWSWSSSDGLQISWLTAKPIWLDIVSQPTGEQRNLRSFVNLSKSF